MEFLYDKQQWINQIMRDRIYRFLLSRNLNTIHQDEIEWGVLCMNRGYYEINYNFLKERMDIIREDLMKTVYHPKRLEYYLGLGYDTFDE